MALQEIPLIISNPNTKTVESIDGDFIHVLIDGNEVNSGIAPINAEDIESVEVMTNPSLKYRVRGIKKVLNLRLKRKEAPYVWAEVDVHGSVPFCSQFFEGAFEIGNPRMGLYGNVYGDYSNERTNYNSMRVTPEYTLDYTGKLSGESWNTLSDLMFKLMPTSNDYFAVKALYRYKYSKRKQNDHGFMYVDDREQMYALEGHGRFLTEVVSGSAYYKHKFREESTLEITGNYDYSRNRPIYTTYSTIGEAEPVVEPMSYLNSRHTGNLNLTWDLNDARDNYWLTGVMGNMNLVNIRYFSGNISNYDNDQYSLKAFAGWSHAFFSNKLSVNFEASVENLWLSDAVYNRHYVYAGGSAGFNYNFNSKWGLTASYILSNSAPALRYLNPYNTSTDPLFEEVGNPDLSPERHHNAFAHLYFSADGWFITSAVSYRRDDNLAVKYGYFKPNGVYVYTFRNGGHRDNISPHLMVSKRISNGRVYVDAGPQWQFIRNQHEHLIWDIRATFNKYFKKFNFDASLHYISRYIGEYNVVDYKGVLDSRITANYNFTPDFFIGLTLRHIFGRLTVRDVYNSGGYHTISELYHKDRDFRVMLTVSYTFRKNIQRKIKMDNVLRGVGGKAISIER